FRDQAEGDVAGQCCQRVLQQGKREAVEGSVQFQRGFEQIAGERRNQPFQATTDLLGWNPVVVGNAVGRSGENRQRGRRFAASWWLPGHGWNSPSSCLGHSAPRSSRPSRFPIRFYRLEM